MYFRSHVNYKQMFRLSLIFFFFFLLGNGQSSSLAEIDSALDRIYIQAHKTSNFQGGIVSTQKIIAKSKKMNYDAGISRGYLNIANFLIAIGGNKESLHYLELADHHSQKTSNHDLKSELYGEYSAVYDKLGMFNISLDYNNKAIEINKKKSFVPNRKKNLISSYYNKADLFLFLKKYDSAYSNYHKSYKLIPDPISASGLARYFMHNDRNDMDSADYYMKVATDSISKYQYSPYQQLYTLETLGDLNFTKKKYDKALENYFQALDISLKSKDLDQTISIYLALFDTYQELKNDKKAAEYILKYNKLNDSISLVNKDALNISVDKLMRDKDQEKKNVEYNAIYTFVAIFGVIFILVIIGNKIYRRKQREKEFIIHRQQTEITKTKSENKTLENKVNDAFQEVLELAKTNDPSFLARFKEVYPEFCEKLLSNYPDIVSSEFTFCAYLKLNLSSKEIANYTFVSLKAIQVRKSRIRKKFNIPSDIDLYFWINKI